MNKKSGTIAIALLALCALPSMAQNPQDNSGNNVTVCPVDQNVSCTVEPAQCCGESIQNRRHGRRMARHRFNCFEGLNLTAEQQSAIKNLCSSENPRRKYLTGLKKILTPEQYVVFLENSFVGRHHQRR